MKNFKKIVLTIMLGILVLLPSAVYAKTEVKSEEELKAATKNGGDIVLQNDITLKSGLEIEGSNVIVDLNGKTITIDESSYIFLKKGNLEFTGTGIIKDVTDNNQSTPPGSAQAVWQRSARSPRAPSPGRWASCLPADRNLWDTVSPAPHRRPPPSAPCDRGTRCQYN